MKKPSQFEILIIFFILFLIGIILIRQTINRDDIKKEVVTPHPCEKQEEAIKDDCYKAMAENEADSKLCGKVKDRRKQTICKRTVSDKVREFEEAKAEFEATHQMMPLE
jgi:hypothetical protein